MDTFTETQSQLSNSEIQTSDVKHLYQQTEDVSVDNSNSENSEVGTEELRKIIDNHEKSTNLVHGGGEWDNSESAQFVNTEELREIIDNHEKTQNMIQGGGDNYSSESAQFLNTEELKKVIEEHERNVENSNIVQTNTETMTHSMKHPHMLGGDDSQYNVKYNIDGGKLRIDFTDIETQIKEINSEIDSMSGFKDSSLKLGGGSANTPVGESLNYYYNYKKHLVNKI